MLFQNQTGRPSYDSVPMKQTSGSERLVTPEIEHALRMVQSPCSATTYSGSRVTLDILRRCYTRGRSVTYSEGRVEVDTIFFADVKIIILGAVHHSNVDNQVPV